MAREARFYLNGGGLFTAQGRWWDEQVESLFRELGADVFDPRRESKEGQLRAETPHENLRRHVFLSDRNGVDVSQGVIMLGEGAAGEVSSGTAWEVGYAHARKKLILCVRTDYRGVLNPVLKECLSDGKICGSLDDLRDEAGRAIEKIRRSGGGLTSYDPPARPRAAGIVFLSAPYYSAAEFAYAKELERGLSKLGHDVIFPAREPGIREELASGAQGPWSRLFEEKVRGLEESGSVIALLEGADCGSETGWDCGYGYSRYKPVFGVRTDFRSQGDLAGPVNLMIEQSLVGSKLCRSLDEVERFMGARR